MFKAPLPKIRKAQRLNAVTFQDTEQPNSNNKPFPVIFGRDINLMSLS